MLISGYRIRTGHLVALRTKADVDTYFQTVEAYIADIPPKSANSVLNVVDSAIQTREPINLHHLRRFIKPASLPPQLRVQHDQKVLGDLQRSEDEAHPTVLHFLICAVRTLPREEVVSLLSSTNHSTLDKHSFNIRCIPVPLLPPSSAEEADYWSCGYWPTIFRKNNPFGPHPSIVARATNEIAERAGIHMGLARLTAQEGYNTQIGLPIGAVVVDRGSAGNPTAVIAAGDTRWTGTIEGFKDRTGNVMGHAVMRAIALVARKRREILGKTYYRTQIESEAFADLPLTEVERLTYAKGILAPDGYLCLDLEIYITHEPCVMCSMAILHSRFGKVVFEKQMPRTGGLMSEALSTSPQCPDHLQNNYGLFWRPELNWKLLAWQWADDEPLQSDLELPQCHA